MDERAGPSQPLITRCQPPQLSTTLNTHRPAQGFAWRREGGPGRCIPPPQPPTSGTFPSDGRGGCAKSTPCTPTKWRRKAWACSTRSRPPGSAGPAAAAAAVLLPAALHALGRGLLPLQGPPTASLRRGQEVEAVVRRPLLDGPPPGPVAAGKR